MWLEIQFQFPRWGNDSLRFSKHESGDIQGSPITVFSEAICHTSFENEH